MKKGVVILIIAAVALFVVINPLRVQAFENIFSYSPCASPIPYRIGTIDERFAISEDQLQTDISEAANAWSSVYGKPLFVYDPNAKLTVNLVYDRRQDLSNQITDLKGQLETDKDAMEPEVAEYDRRSAAFDEKLATLNKEIDEWNNKGGAPEEEYNKLKKRQEDLQVEADALNVMARKLNQSSDNFSAKVGELNNTVNRFNSALLVRPEEGLYDPNNNTISIYFHTNQQEFLHTLSHELGHALGISHVENKNAIMYTQTNTQRTPTSEDIIELMKVCRKRSYVEIALDRYKILYDFYFNKNK